MLDLIHIIYLAKPPLDIFSYILAYIVQTYFIAKYDTAMGLGQRFSQH